MKKLDLGCGASCREGHIGIDINGLVRPDIVMDLDIESLVDLFGENSIDAISSCHFLEHSRNFIRIVTQMWIISKPGAVWDIQVPPADCEIGNPFHNRAFTEWTFRFFEVTDRFAHPVLGGIGVGITDGNCPVKLREIEQSRTATNLRIILEVVK